MHYTDIFLNSDSVKIDPILVSMTCSLYLYVPVETLLLYSIGDLFSLEDVRGRPGGER